MKPIHILLWDATCGTFLLIVISAFIDLYAKKRSHYGGVRVKIIGRVFAYVSSTLFALLFLSAAIATVQWMVARGN